MECDNQRFLVSVVVAASRQAASSTSRWVLTSVSEDHRAKRGEMRNQVMEEPCVHNDDEREQYMDNLRDSHKVIIRESVASNVVCLQ